MIGVQFYVASKPDRLIIEELEPLGVVSGSNCQTLRLDGIGYIESIKASY